MKQLIPDVVPERPRVKYDGYNIGDCVGWAHAKNWSTSWQLRVEKKVQLYGAFLIPPTSSTEETIPVAEGLLAGGRQLDDVEPAFYHSLPEEYYHDIFRSFSVKAVIDVTAGMGEAAKAALTLRLPYLGVVLTPPHGVLLEEHLKEWVHAAMQDDPHPLHKLGCRTAPPLQTAPAADAPEPADGPGAGATDAKPDKKAGATDKGKTQQAHKEMTTKAAVEEKPAVGGSGRGDDESGKRRKKAARFVREKSKSDSENMSE